MDVLDEVLVVSGAVEVELLGVQYPYPSVVVDEGVVDEVLVERLVVVSDAVEVVLVLVSQP